MSRQENYTIGEWADVWFDIYAENRYAKRTLELHTDSRRRVKTMMPEIEGLPLPDLTTLAFQTLLNQMAEKYSKSTISKARFFYNSLYKFAKKNKVCLENPIEETEIPIHASVKVIEALSRQEEQALKAILIRLPQVDEFMIRFFLLTGLRRKELLSLKWCDWNKAEHRISIRDSKTKAGIRTLLLVPADDTDQSKIV